MLRVTQLSGFGVGSGAAVGGNKTLSATGGSFALTGTAATVVKATPTPIAGMIGWYDASVTASLTLSGSNITAVADQSGAGNHLSEVSSFPTYNATGLNSKPTMVFSTSFLGHDHLAFGTGNTLTVFCVAQFTSSSNSYGRLVSYTADSGGNDANTNNSWLLSRDSNTTSAVLYRNSSTASRTFGTYGTPHRCIATIDSSGVMKIYIDGVATTGSTLNAAFGSPGQLIIGNLRSGTPSPIDGNISEVGISTAFTNATDVATLDAYLQTKWGL